MKPKLLEESSLMFLLRKKAIDLENHGRDSHGICHVYTTIFPGQNFYTVKLRDCDIIHSRFNNVNVSNISNLGDFWLELRLIVIRVPQF